MTEIAGFPYFQVQFTKKGVIFDQQEVNAVLDTIADESITDLLFVSHGWNNNSTEATRFYTDLITHIRTILNPYPEIALPGRNLGFVGLFWPSKRFTAIELRPGGGAGLGGVITERMLSDELESLSELSDADNAEQLIEQAKNLLNELEDRKSSQDTFVDLIRELLADDDSDEEVDDEMPAAIGSLAGRDLIDQLSRPGLLELSPAADGAAGIGDFFGGIKGGTMNFLNLSTYWKMKKRAGKVGLLGLYEVLRQVEDQHAGLNVHLVGHSFGGRLVTNACKGPDDRPAVTVNSLTLLQAAFSHNGFAENFLDQRDGFFRSVVSEQRVTGPVLITHTKNDKAVGLVYPLASRISGYDVAAIGDKDDHFGGIGRNGAQHTPEAISRFLQSHDKTYLFESGGYYNLQADDFIANHGDVSNLAVANLVVNALAAV